MKNKGLIIIIISNMNDNFFPEILLGFSLLSMHRPKILQQEGLSQFHCMCTTLKLLNRLCFKFGTEIVIIEDYPRYRIGYFLTHKTKNLLQYKGQSVINQLFDRLDAISFVLYFQCTQIMVLLPLLKLKSNTHI